MKILAIDTATGFLALGAFDNGKVYEVNLNLGRSHSVLLMPVIKRVLDALGWASKEIDYFALGLGPGSFTGIRVGVSSIKGLAWSTNKPIVGISTLDILAKNVQAEGQTIVPVIDARRSLIYASAYKIRLGQLKRIKPYMLLSKEELFKKIKGECFIFGDAIGAYKDYWYPQGHNIIELALERIKSGKISSAFNIKPIYLFPKECQIRK